MMHGGLEMNGSIRMCAGVCTAMLLSAAVVRGADTQPAPPADVLRVPQMSIEPELAPESIDEELADAKARPAGILSYGPVSLIDPAWKAMNTELDKVGLKVGMAYTAVFQAASNGPGTRTAAGGDIDLFGDWRLLGQKDDPMVGLLYFAAEQRSDLGTGIAPGGLGKQIASLWGTTNGFGEQVLTVKELYWEQRFEKDRVILRIGKLDPENYYNSNYWQSDSKYFLNGAFSTFPVRAFPGQGLGINVSVKPADWWYISAGAQDAQGKKTTAGFNTLFDDFNLFSAFEVGFTPVIPGLGKGTYRFTGWYRDAGDSYNKPHDAGFDISFDQQINAHLRPFFRYGTGEGNINGIKNLVSGGIGWEGKLLFNSDVVGLGGAWGEPTSSAARNQYALEAFYRMQVSPDNQITVGYQVILDPANDPTSDVVGVLELRWRITF